MSAMQILIVDDEALARSRLRTLLADCSAPAAEVVAEAAQAEQAQALLVRHAVDLVLLDIHMPGVDGLAFARALQARPQAPAVVFVTAHAAHAVTAFELDAVDYLTKPVRAERLQQALQKTERYLKDRRALQPDLPEESVVILDRGQLERVPLSEVLYLKSELKYLTVRTASRSHVLEGTLADFEERHPAHFVRVHRNALVARHAIRALERHEEQDIETWALRLQGVPEPVQVSRRQLAAIRDVLREPR